jgi:hypothetical protein
MNKAIETILYKLSFPYNPDFWSEVECPALVANLRKLDDSDWQDLLGCLNQLSDFGKIHLAEAVRQADHIMGNSILIELLRSPNSIVGAFVAEQLIENDYLWDPKVSILADLKRHLDQSEGYDHKTIERLISRLPR